MYVKSRCDKTKQFHKRKSRYYDNEDFQLLLIYFIGLYFYCNEDSQKEIFKDLMFLNEAKRTIPT